MCEGAAIHSHNNASDPLKTEKYIVFISKLIEIREGSFMYIRSGSDGRFVGGPVVFVNAAGHSSEVAF